MAYASKLAITILLVFTKIIVNSFETLLLVCRTEQFKKMPELKLYDGYESFKYKLRS